MVYYEAIGFGLAYLRMGDSKPFCMAYVLDYTKYWGYPSIQLCIQDMMCRSGLIGWSLVAFWEGMSLQGNSARSWIRWYGPCYGKLSIHDGRDPMHGSLYGIFTGGVL